MEILKITNPGKIYLFIIINKKENWIRNNKVKFNISVKNYNPPIIIMRFNTRLNLLMNNNLVNIMTILKILMVMNIFSIILQKNVID